jgi:hypothetical protein
MGLFGPPKEFRARTFSAPCTADEFLSVLVRTDGIEFGTPFAILAQSPLDAPPLEEQVYLEKSDGRNFVIAAGNRTHSKWKMHLSLEGDNPVQGQFGSVEFNTEQWFANVWEMNTAIRNTLRSIGGRTGKWPGSF